jgi:hypothetical protein
VTFFWLGLDDVYRELAQVLAGKVGLCLCPLAPVFNTGGAAPRVGRPLALEAFTGKRKLDSFLHQHKCRSYEWRNNEKHEVLHRTLIPYFRSLIYSNNEADFKSAMLPGSPMIRNHSSLLGRFSNIGLRFLRPKEAATIGLCSAVHFCIARKPWAAP